MSRLESATVTRVFVSILTVVGLAVGLIGCAPGVPTPTPSAIVTPAATSSAIATPTATPIAIATPTATSIGLPRATPTLTQAKVYKARFSIWLTKTDIRSVYITKFADMVRTATGGQVDITVYYSGQLFNSTDSISAVGKNAVESTLLPGGILPSFIPEYSAEQLWFVLNAETTERLWKGTEAGKKVIAAEQSKLNVRVVGWIPLGPNALFSRSLITKLEDFNGKKARYISKPSIPFYQALGMTYVSIGTEEIFPSLQGGMVDVIPTAPGAIKNFSWWDYTKYAVLPYLGWFTGQVAFNADWWATLPKDLQDKVIGAGQAITKESFDAISADANAFYDEFKQHGGTVTTLSADEVGRIQQALAGQGAFDEAKKQIGPELWEAIRTVSGTKMQ